MKPGDVILIPPPQATAGPPKLRPALILSVFPGRHQDVLVCGISTQLGQQVPNWDELIQPGESDFSISGLHQASIVRLSFLHAADPGDAAGVIGEVDPQRLSRVLTRLADYLRPE